MSEKSDINMESTVSVSELEEIIAAKDKEIEALRLRIEHLQEIILNAQRARFGSSSEKKKYVLPDQMSFFNEAEAEQDVKAPEPTPDTVHVEAHERKKKGTVDEKTADLPVKKIILELPEDEQNCEQCGVPLTMIGKKLARRELEFIPAHLMVIEYYTCSYACHECEKKTGEGYVISTVAPKPLMKHSMASPSSVATVMTRKYADGLPLARQEKIWKREGIELSRATMANWVIKCAEDWLKPIYRRMKHHLLEGKVIHADETVVQVLKEPGKPAQSESRMWVYASGQRDVRQVRFFEYQPDRKGRRPIEFLKGFKGCLVSDGYAAYQNIPDVTLCGCWAHYPRTIVIRGEMRNTA